MVNLSEALIVTLHWLSIAIQLRVQLISPFPLYARLLTDSELLLHRFCIGNHSCCMFMNAVALSYPEEYYFTPVFPDFWLLQSFCFQVLICSLSLGVVATDTPFVMSTPALLLVVGACINLMYCTKKLLWWGLRAELICGRHTNLEGNLIYIHLAKY